MLFVAIGVMFLAPSVLHFGNRVLSEVIIPNKDIKALKKRRAEQAKLGIPEEQREVFVPVPLKEYNIELTEAEKQQLIDMGAIDILMRASNRRAAVKKIEEANKKEEADGRKSETPPPN